MLTTRAIKFIALFSTCLIIGLLLGNRILTAISLVPLSLIIIGFMAQPPGHITIKNQNIVGRAWVEDTLEVNHEVTVGSGLGSFSLYQEVPPYFEIVEGNNWRVFWKGLHPQTYSYSYKIRCTKRGGYIQLPVKWEANHLLRFIPTRSGELGERHELSIHPKIMNVRRIRGVPGIAATPFPVIDMAKIGVTTTDFREIRKYVYGDPVKNINWKATARVTGPQAWPLINEYEVEGKKSVWLFLDASEVLEVGTDVENVFEHCLEAANSVAYFFLDRGYKIGMYVFNTDNRLIYPDAGKKQFLKISRALIDVQSGNKTDEFPVAIEKCRRYILGYNPLCVVVTRLDSRHYESLLLGVKKLRQLRGRQRRKLPVMVINVPAYNILAGDGEFDANTQLLMQLNTRPRELHLRRLGTSVLDWNPKKENFGTALLRLMKTR